MIDGASGGRKIDLAFAGRLVAVKFVPEGTVDQKFVVAPLDADLLQSGIDFLGCSHRLGDVQSRPPCEIPDAGRTFD